MSTAQAGFKRGTAAETAADLLVRVGPTLLVDVGLRSLTPSWPPDLPRKRVHALIDTGAGADGIDNSLALALKLPVVDRVEMSGIGGKQEADVYMARVYVPPLDKLLFQRFTGVMLEEGEQSHRIILGRGFLRPYRLMYDGTTGMVEVTNDPAPNK